MDQPKVKTTKSKLANRHAVQSLQLRATLLVDYIYIANKKSFWLCTAPKKLDTIWGSPLYAKGFFILLLILYVF